MRGSNSTLPARAMATFSTSAKLVDTPGRPISTAKPTSPSTNRPVTSFVFISAVPRPMISVSGWDSWGSLNRDLMILGHPSSGWWRASYAQAPLLRQAAHSTQVS